MSALVSRMCSISPLALTTSEFSNFGGLVIIGRFVLRSLLQITMEFGSPDIRERSMNQLLGRRAGQLQRPSRRQEALRMKYTVPK